MRVREREKEKELRNFVLSVRLNDDDGNDDDPWIDLNGVRKLFESLRYQTLQTQLCTKKICPKAIDTKPVFDPKPA